MGRESVEPDDPARELPGDTRPIGFQGSKQVLFNVTIVIRSVLLKHEVEPALKSLMLAFALALVRCDRLGRRAAEF